MHVPIQALDSGVALGPQKSYLLRRSNRDGSLCMACHNPADVGGSMADRR